VDVALGQDALGQGVFQLGPFDDAADVERQVAQAVAEPEQRFDRRDFSRTRGGGEVLQGVHPGLDVGDGDRAYRLADEAEKVGGISGVSALGVLAAAVEPELDELLVTVDLGDGRQCVGGKRPIRRCDARE